jgi:hypothetical protein
MKHGPSQQSTDGRASASLYFDLLADFFNRIDPQQTLKGSDHRRVEPSFGVRQPSKLSRYIR